MEWKLISRPPGRKAWAIISQLWRVGCLWGIVLFPFRATYILWRLNILYQWEGVWTDGSSISVRVFNDGKSIIETLWNAYWKGTAWKEETNDATLVKNFEIPEQSMFGDILIIVAPGDAKFPTIEVLDAQEVIIYLRAVVNLAKKATQSEKIVVERKSRVESEAQFRLAVEDEIERLRSERNKGGD